MQTTVSYKKFLLKISCVSIFSISLYNACFCYRNGTVTHIVEGMSEVPRATTVSPLLVHVIADADPVAGFTRGHPHNERHTAGRQDTQTSGNLTHFMATVNIFLIAFHIQISSFFFVVITVFPASILSDNHRFRVHKNLCLFTTAFLS